MSKEAKLKRLEFDEKIVKHVMDETQEKIDKLNAHRSLRKSAGVNG